ncbi:MAG: T9SS type A sorting domain-containing protein [Ignavibacteria bacterium]|nr:T9SS type A sorting domain-containing protein [Ignavibacteria bacterium]
MVVQMKKIIFLISVIASTVFAQFPNIRVSQPSSTDPNETSIAINPLDTLNLVAGANIRYYYYSTDGGYTWFQGNLSSPLGVWGDPCVVFDLNGHCYFGHLSNPSSGGYWIDRIVVQKSTNKGISWSSGVGIGYNPPTRNQDKEWLAVDWTNSSYRNNIYMAWTEFDSYGSSNPQDSSRILFSRSTDGGATWSAPVRVSDKGGDCIDEDNTVEGAVPAIGPNGEVYLAWAGPLGLVFDKSTDGGLSWGIDKVITSIPGGWDFNVPGIYRCNGLPVTACDISNSPYRGTIYVNWSDQRNGTNNTDIFLVKSTDGGNTWSQPKKVNQDNTQTHQFFTWMTVDPATGYLYFVYYDRRTYTDNRTDVYLARSTDGGETFTEFKISQSPFTPTSSIFFGDYTGITALNGKVYPIWTRLENNQRSVWIAIFQDTIKTLPTTSFSLTEGWNLLSVPLKKQNMFYKDLFPASNSYAYNYQNGYQKVDTLEVGRGYWLKFPAAQNVTIQGLNLNEITIPINAGWNLVGGLNGIIPVTSIQTNPPGILTSPFYEYNAGYQTSSQITKGKGYWIKSASAGEIILNLSGLVRGNINEDFEIEKIASIEISDKNNSMRLFVTDKVVNKEFLELPPLPPSNIFDIRFDDNTNVMFKSERRLVRIQSESSTAILNYKSFNDVYLKIIFLDGKELLVKSDERISIDLTKNKEFYLEILDKLSNAQKEKENFFVSEVFPNPFNSTTKIRIYIPQEVGEDNKFFAEIRIYNLLGELVSHNSKVATSGYNEFRVEFNEQKVSSGLYFCEVIIQDLKKNLIHRELKKLNYIK